MDHKTLKALRGSIKKWECICMGMAADGGQRNCPLCQMFFDYECIGCVVRGKTGEDYCDNTPYRLFESWYDPGDERFANSASIDYGIAELEFLESLLPENNG